MSRINLSRPDDAALFMRHMTPNAREAFVHLAAGARIYRQTWPGDSPQGALYLFKKGVRVWCHRQDGLDREYRPDLYDARASDWVWSAADA